MYEAELAVRVFAPKRGVAFHRGRAIGTEFDHRDLVPQPPSEFGVRVERLDHEPLIWVSSTYFGPAHT